MTKQTITVSALMRRINRKLAHDGLRLCKTRNPGDCTSIRRDLGDYHVVAGNWVRATLHSDVDLIDYGRELGCVAHDEGLA